MLRRGLLVVFALIFGVVSVAALPPASAQDEECTYNCAVQIEGPDTDTPDSKPYRPENVAGAFANSEGPSSEVVPTPVAQATPVPEATSDVDAPNLAFTGSETTVLSWVGSSMIAAGAIALAVRRRIGD